MLIARSFTPFLLELMSNELTLNTLITNINAGCRDEFGTLPGHIIFVQKGKNTTFDRTFTSKLMETCL